MCGGRLCLPSPPMCLYWYCPQISLWWRTDAGDQSVRGEEECGLHSHFILAFCLWQTWCGRSVQLPAVEDWKRCLKLPIAMQWIKTQVQLVRFTRVLTSYVCCNANHGSILLIHHSLQRDERSPNNTSTGYHVFFFMTPKTPCFSFSPLKAHVTLRGISLFLHFLIFLRFFSFLLPCTPSHVLHCPHSPIPLKAKCFSYVNRQVF